MKVLGGQKRPEAGQKSEWFSRVGDVTDVPGRIGGG